MKLFSLLNEYLTVLFGVGFVVRDHCPGTAVEGRASGRPDALVTLVGVSIGSLLFAVFYPSLEVFYNTSSMGSVMLPWMIRVNHRIIIDTLVIFAIEMFYLRERFEKGRGPSA